MSNTKFKEGDRVKLRDNSPENQFFRAGYENLIIKKVGVDDYSVWESDKSDFWYCDDDDLELMEDKMNKEEALEKIEELKKFVEECDNKKLTIEEEINKYPERFEELDRGFGWCPFFDGCEYKIIKSKWNLGDFEGKLYYVESEFGNHSIIRRKIK